MKIPDSDNSISNLIDRHHESLSEPPRPHMGCSQLGHPCDRWLWLSFRWAVQPKFPGRILRLFRRGQLEESTIVSDLRAIGMDVRGTGRQQSRVEFGAHVSGSIDAIIEYGVPDAPRTRHVAEFKTHSKKSFDDLEKNGVEKSKPEHFVQMQLYMHGTKIDRALYVAVCKNDDRIYTERLRYDHEVAERYIARGRRIALSDRMPEFRLALTRVGINASSATRTSSATKPKQPSTLIAAHAHTARPRKAAHGAASATTATIYPSNFSPLDVRATSCTRIWCHGSARTV